MSAHGTELVIFTLLFALVTGLGFYAVRWNGRHPQDNLDQWGLGGRRFGFWVSWFLNSGEIFTAYTFVALPTLMFGIGAMGFFAVPFTMFAYPLVFLPLVRLWSISRKRGYKTPADFVATTYNSPTLGLVVALTGIIATMPYLALQLAGLEAVLRTMGLNSAGLAGHAPIFVAFILMAAYTYRSGLRAPALIAFVKAMLIYPVIIAAVLLLPAKLGGWGSIFDAAGAKFTPATGGHGLLLGANNQLEYVTLALGSAFALFLYPHTLTGVFAARDPQVIKRNLVALPAYSLVLGMFALLGYAAIAAHTQPLTNAATGQADSNTVIPMLFQGHFPPWFAGIAFAALGIGTLVPASVMSIAAANLWTRNIYKPYLQPDATEKQEATQSKIASLVVKFGAVAMLVLLNPQYSLDLQLIAGVIILQTLPLVAIALYTRWFHPWALIAGWATGMAWGLFMLISIPNLHTGIAALELGRLWILGWVPFPGSPVQIYPGFVALVGNLIVATVATAVLRRLIPARARQQRPTLTGPAPTASIESSTPPAAISENIHSQK
ncbi:MAG: sodium:solute symporter family protein [Pseudonocardiaceae bacterium]